MMSSWQYANSQPTRPQRCAPIPDLRGGRVHSLRAAGGVRVVGSMGADTPSNNVGDALPREVCTKPEDELSKLLVRAKRSVEGWEVFRAALHDRADAQSGYAAAERVAVKLEPLIRSQVASHATVGPHSTGPSFRHLETTVGDRAARMTHKRRADALLMLLAAKHNGWFKEETLRQAHPRSPRCSPRPRAQPAPLHRPQDCSEPLLSPHRRA